MKYILFDCDGVLVDTEAVAAKVVTHWLTTCGFTISEERFINDYTGKTFGAIFNQLVEDGNLNRKFWKDDTILSLEETIYRNVELVDGIMECVEGLKSYNKAVISNSRKNMVEKALKVTGLDNHFSSDKIYSAELVALPKPDPGVYLRALEELNVKPENCIAIEDSVTGVMAASGAGIPTIGFAGASHLQKGHDKKLYEAGARKVAYHAREIYGLIDS